MVSSVALVEFPPVSGPRCSYLIQFRTWKVCWPWKLSLVWWLDRAPPPSCSGRRESSRAVPAVTESRSGQAGRADLITSFPHPGVQLMMLGVHSLLLLWGLATPCLGLLETVGTLARIDKDELGKGEAEACGQAGRDPAATVCIRDTRSS